MLRELIDITVLEDFVAGLARASGSRAAVFGVRGVLLAASPPGSSARTNAPFPRQLPNRLEMMKLMPVPDPRASVAFVEHEGLWTIVAPVNVGKSVAGFVGLGPYRDSDGQVAASLDATDWQRLPVLKRAVTARPVAIARWASRMLADWCLNEARLDAAADEVSLLGDIGGLISGGENLQKVLDQIVADTARVMNLPYCTLRLYDRKTGALTLEAGYTVLGTRAAELSFRRSENPIDDAALRGEIVYVEDATRDKHIPFAEAAKRLGIVSGMAAGMIYRGEPIGVLRVYADHKKRFRRQHRNLLQAVASQAAIAVANARLLEERLRSAHMQRQLTTAGQVQSRMVRIPPPDHPRLETALLFEPSLPVGGDFCDVFTLPDGRLAALVGDVAGHGVPAALVMASARGALRTAARYCRDLAELVEQLNRHIHRETTSAEFVTLLLVAVDRDARRLEYVNAGHEPLLLFRDEKVLETDQADLVLGVEPSQSYAAHRLELQPRDFILLYTDGVVEAMNFEDQVFGRQRLFKALKQYAKMPTDQALGNIRWDVRRFVGLVEQSDDLTMVGLRVCGEGEAAGEA